MYYFSNFTIDTELYVFQTGPLSIIRSISTPYTQQQVFVILVMLTVCQQKAQQTDNITSMTNTYCCVYIVETPGDGQQICPKHVDFFIKINLRNIANSLAFIIRRSLEAVSFSPCNLTYIPFDEVRNKFGFTILQVGTRL